jgi:NinB protein
MTANQTTFSRICTTREAAHAAINAGYAQAKVLLALGRDVAITIAEHEDDRSVAQNRYYWGPCLTEISEQAVVGGQRWTVDAWHELFKRQFIGYGIKKVKVAGRKKATVIRSLKSTTDLTVRQFSDYLDKLQAFAAAELGVLFSIPDWYEHAGIARQPARSRKSSSASQPAKEAVA